MRAAALLLAVGLSLAGCSGDRSKAPTTPSSPTAPTTSPATLSRVWLCCGSNQVSINTDRQIEMRATYSDGSHRDVTSAATSWRSSNPNVATISDKGVVRGLAEGKFEISASYEGLQATWGMYVEVNPYRDAAADEVIGYVRELTANGEVYIWRAEVEVVGGASNGRKVLTDTGGLFRIGGLQAPGFDLVIREAGYSSNRFRVTELGRDVSASTIMKPAPMMISDVLEGPVCWPTRTISTTFRPTAQGFLRITSSRFVSTFRQVYENGILIDRHLFNNTDVPTRAGATYELRVTGNCDYNPSTNVRLTYLRPR
jgi:hypothetical protein